MLMKEEIVMTANEIKNMTYTQFVAYIDQWNVPPGSLNTINQWAVFGHVNENSNVLEIACTTGLSSREIARITGCSSTGIDICRDSIQSAKMNAEIYGKDLRLKYVSGDACEYKTEEKFSHVIIGASLGFFKEPQKMLDRMTSFFDGTGYVLASPYYRSGTMPDDLIKDCQRVIGITPTTMSYDAVRDTYANFEVLYENRCSIVLETKAQMEKYTYDSIERACQLRKITDADVKKAMYDRLYEIKDVSNELHRYQAYSVLVLRYLNGVYPNKFLELF